MDITYDPAKDTVNLAKHGVSLRQAHELQWDIAFIEVDDRRDYGETRMIGYAPIGGRVFCVIFTDRGDSRRIISLRKASKREVDRYEREI